jgi:hypothetical protein
MSVRSRILARVVAVTALRVALAARRTGSDPLGNVADGPATGDAAKLEAADGDRFTRRPGPAGGQRGHRRGHQHRRPRPRFRDPGRQPEHRHDRGRCGRHRHLHRPRGHRDGIRAARRAWSAPGTTDSRRRIGRRCGHRLAGSSSDHQGGVMATTPHRSRSGYLLDPDLARGRARQPVAWLLEADEADRRTRVARRHRRRRRRLTRTTGAGA